MSARRVPLLLMRLGGVLVAAAIAGSYLAWALSYSQVSLAPIALPVVLVLSAGVLLFVAGAVAGTTRR